MNQQGQVKTRGGGSRLLSGLGKFPWTLSLIAYMVTVHLVQAAMAGTTGYVFLGLCMFVMFVEFFKSGDIAMWAFFLDLLGSVASLVLATVLMCYLYLKIGQSPTFFHWFGYAVILGDAVLGPFNAFRTALRNIGLDASG